MVGGCGIQRLPFNVQNRDMGHHASVPREYNCTEGEHPEHPPRNPDAADVRSRACERIPVCALFGVLPSCRLMLASRLCLLGLLLGPCAALVPCAFSSPARAAAAPRRTAVRHPQLALVPSSEPPPELPTPALLKAIERCGSTATAADVAADAGQDIGETRRQLLSLARLVGASVRPFVRPPAHPSRSFALSGRSLCASSCPSWTRVHGSHEVSVGVVRRLYGRVQASCMNGSRSAAFAYLPPLPHALPSRAPLAADLEASAVSCQLSVRTTVA
jgi:hypothetical protein